MGVFSDGRKGFRGIPKGVLPPRSKTNHAYDARPGAGIVVEIAGRIGDRTGRSRSKIVGIEIAIEFGKIGGQPKTNERGVRIGKSSGESLGAPRGIHVERIRV